MLFSRPQIWWREDGKMEEQGAKGAWHNGQRKLGRWELKGSSLQWEGGGRVCWGTADVVRGNERRNGQHGVHGPVGLGDKGCCGLENWEPVQENRCDSGVPHGFVIVRGEEVEVLGGWAGAANRRHGWGGSAALGEDFLRGVACLS